MRGGACRVITAQPELNAELGNRLGIGVERTLKHSLEVGRIR